MLNELWDKSTKLFNPREVTKTFKSEIPKASLNKALLVLAIAISLSVVISIINVVESGYFRMFRYDVLAEVADIEEMSIDWGPFIPYTISRIFILIPAMFILTYVFERISYELLKRTGGKGTFEQQLYLVSLISFSLMVASMLLFIAPVPCLGAPLVLLFVLSGLYFAIFVTGKAYQLVHEIGMMHAIGVIIVVGIPKIISILLVNDIFGVLGLPDLPFE